MQGFIADHLVPAGILRHSLKPSRSRIPHSSGAVVPGLWVGEDAQATQSVIIEKKYPTAETTIAAASEDYTPHRE